MPIRNAEEDQFDAYGFNPVGYINFEAVIKGKGVDDNLKKIAISAFRSGIRKVEKRENPKYCRISDILDFFPAHIELGCGPSIECGVPALNTLHKIYSITKNSRFVFSANDESFYDFLKNPEKKFIESSSIHTASLLAEPATFYLDLNKLIKCGLFIEPIFTNNFDGIPISVGIKEHCLRKYDIDYIYPDYEMNSEAKALFVIGAHADRRKLQLSARKKGLKIIHVNPEGYINRDDFIQYPVEAPKNEDYLLKMTAREFTTNLAKVLKIKQNHEK
ncbi:MAG: hypothetical protein IPN76_07025 [Saprospiraceae bacterium]|nr:hypothetical protein [Saprospiraceae bacterium]